MSVPASALLAQSLLDSGATVLTHVPGYGGTEVFRELRRRAPFPLWDSFHEEVAYTLAHGAAMAGQRAACLIKTHGFAKATNSVLSSLSCGTRAGFVTLVFDDPEGSHSDNIFDAEGFLRGSEAPYRRIPAADAEKEIPDAFDRSERTGLPEFLLIDCNEAQAQVAPSGKTPPPRRPRPELPVAEDRLDPYLHLVCPLLSRYQRKIFEAKKSGRWNPSLLREIPRPKLPPIPEGLPEPIRSAAMSYQPFFEVFRGIRGELVMGDAGSSALFGLEPYRCVDVGTYMGGSVPLALGAQMAGKKDTWAVTGDFSFLAAGHYGILEAVQRQLPLKLALFANGKASATGNQTIPSGLLESVLAPYARAVREIRLPTASREELERVVMEAHQSPEMRILLIRN